MLRCPHTLRSARCLGRRQTHTSARSITASADIRNSFQQFFKSQQHLIVPSSSLIPPSDDATLLFTSAGMVQFKSFFLSQATPPSPRLTSCQKCLRVGGKHNDLDNVGFTARHLTLFEMLGNFSFFDYGKEQAIQFAWQYLTSMLKLPEHMLRITVHHSDTESRNIWQRVTGWSSERCSTHIVGMGDEDNYWSMGDYGPRGPCTEIFFDQGEHAAERWLEVWNLVFMDSERQLDGSVHPLRGGGLCIDTGMGLERMASVLQNVSTNYDIDSFKPIVETARELVFKHAALNQSASQTNTPSLLVSPSMSDLSFLQNWKGSSTHPLSPSFCVLLDHIRSISFLFLEGVLPSNTSRGYVLRRLIRRALTHAYHLGIHEPYLHSLYPAVAQSLGSVYPELNTRQTQIQSLIEDEERLFYQTLERGLRTLQDEMDKGSHSGKHLRAESAFLLYDTFGFPLDLTEMIAQSKGWKVDTAGFESLMNQQREQSRSRSTVSGSAGARAADSAEAVMKQWSNNPLICNTFSGHIYLGESNCVVRALHSIDSTESNKEALVVIDPCPFYAAGGGQVTDVGELIFTNNTRVNVTEAIRVNDTLIVLKVNGDLTHVSENQQVTAVVDPRRHRVAAHHTATHLLHAALRQVLAKTGRSISQAGSHVDETRLRFDVTLPSTIKLTTSIIEEVEGLVNRWALAGDNVSVRTMPRVDAEATGAMALFGEKYGDLVRVVSVGDVSHELCGGTHVTNSRSCWPFRILSEGSLAAGVRRIEAVAGEACIQQMSEAFDSNRRLASLLKAPQGDVETAVRNLRESDEKNRLEVKRLTKRLAGNKNWPRIESQSNDQSNNVSYVIHVVPLADAPNLGELKNDAQALLQAEPQRVHILVCPQNSLCCIAANPKISSASSAVKFWQHIVSAVSEDGAAKGGGSPNFAQGSLGTRGNPKDILNAIQTALSGQQPIKQQAD